MAEMELVDVITRDEQNALLKAIGKRAPGNKRNRAAVLLMLRCGLRASEVVGHEKRAGEGGLRIDDVDLTTGKIQLRDTKGARRKRSNGTRGKGRKGRIVYASGETLDALRDWWEVRSKMDANTDHFFVSHRGNPLPARRLRDTMAHYGAKAGIPQEKCHPHALRHTFATELYSQTKNLLLVKKVLGHSSIQTTMIYAHTSGADVHEAMVAFQGSDREAVG